jgi:hypothetical protein
MKTLIAAVAAATLAAGGIAWAAVPDSTGTIHGCYLKAGGIVRVIDEAKGQKCLTSLETPLTWNQAGPPGAVGPKGDNGDPGQATDHAAVQLPKVGFTHANWTTLFDIPGVGRFDVACESPRPDPTGIDDPKLRARYSNTTAAERTLVAERQNESARVPSGASYILTDPDLAVSYRLLVFPGSAASGTTSPTADVSISGVPTVDTFACDFWGSST